MRRAQSTDKDQRHSFNTTAHKILHNSMNTRENSYRRAYTEDVKIQIDELVHELSQKDTQISSLQRNYEAISKACRQEKEETSKWINKHKEIEEVLKNANLNILQLTEGTQSLQSEIEEFKAKQENCKKELASFKNLKRKKIDLEDTLEEVSKDLENKNKALQERISTNEKLMIKMRDLEKQISQMNSKNEHLTRELCETSRIIPDLSHEHSRLEDVLEDKNMVIERLNSQKTALISAQERSQAMNSKLTYQVQEERKELNNSRQQYAELHRRFQELEKSAAQKEGNIKLHCINEIEMKGKINELESKIQEYSDNTYKLQTENKELTQHSYEQISEIQRLNDSLENVTAEYTESQTQCSRLSDRVSELTVKLKDARKTNAELEDSLSAAESKAESERLFQQRSLQSTLRQKDEEIECLQKHIQALNSQIAGSSFTKDQDKENLVFENKNLRGKYLELQDKCNDLKQECSKLTELLASTNLKYSNLEHRFESEKAKNSNLQAVNSDSLSACQRELFEKSQQWYKEKQELEALLRHKGDSLTLKENVKRLEFVIENLNTSESNLNLQLNSAKAEISRLNSLCSRYEEDKIVKSQEIALLKERMMKQKKDDFEVKQLEHKNAVLEKKLKELNIDLFEKEIEELKFALKKEQMKAMSTANENKDLLYRIQLLKDELEKFRPSEIESQRKIGNHLRAIERFGKTVEKMDHALRALETNLACHVCFRGIEGASLNMPCKHVVCKKCKVCTCKNTLNSQIPLHIFDEITGKLLYNRQVLEEFKNILKNN